MSEVIKRIERQMKTMDLQFCRKPIVIGGMAMEYYGFRKSGPDIDLVVSDEDYQALALKNPDKRKDIWGDLGVILEPFEIWRCIALLDYDFYLKDAADEGTVYIVSMERLLLMRAFAMGVPKYMEDLKLIQGHYRGIHQNKEYAGYAEKHIESYKKLDGIVWGGKYLEDMG